MNRLNRCGVLFIIFGFAFQPQAFSQTRDENWTRCRDENAAISLKGCDAVLNSGEEGPRGRFAAFVNRGIAYRDLGLNAHAVQDFTQAISLNGADVEVLMERGATYGQDGEFGKAIHDYNSALDLEGENAAALYARGVFKRLSGNFAGGDADIAAAKRMEPDIARMMADRGITEPNLQAPHTAEIPAGPPHKDFVPTVPPETSVKTEQPTGYPILLIFAGLVLALVIFLLLRPAGSAKSPETVDIPEKSPVRSRLMRTAVIVTGIAALFLIGVVVGRQTGASTSELAQSQFAFGLLSATGRDLEDPYMTEHDISDISVTSDPSQRAAVSITFTSEGASKMRTLTSKNIGRDLVFVIDGSPDVAHPTKIESTIGQNASLSFVSASDAQAYVSKLKASRDPGARYR